MEPNKKRCLKERLVMLKLLPLRLKYNKEKFNNNSIFFELIISIFFSILCLIALITGIDYQDAFLLIKFTLLFQMLCLFSFVIKLIKGRLKINGILIYIIFIIILFPIFLLIMPDAGIINQAAEEYFYFNRQGSWEPRD